MIIKKLTVISLLGLFGLSIFGLNTVNAEDSTSDSLKQRIQERIENKVERSVESRIQKFKDTRAQLKNVRVVAVESASLTVDNGGTNVTVNITDKTQLRRKFWGKSEIAEFSVGDTVSVIGKWTDDTKTAVNAVVIRNESIQKRFGTFFGTVKSVNSTGFVFSTIHRDDETVTIGSAKLINRREEVITQADIKVGDRVRVKGLWNNDAKTITEVREVKDFSLPPLPSRAPKMSPSPTPVATTTP